MSVPAGRIFVIKEVYAEQSDAMELPMSTGQSAKIVGLAGVDPVFTQIRTEAEEIVRREPEVAGFVLGTVLNRAGWRAQSSSVWPIGWTSRKFRRPHSPDLSRHNRP